MIWDVDYHATMDYLCSVLLRDFTDNERAQYGITDDAPSLALISTSNRRRVPLSGIFETAA